MYNNSNQINTSKKKNIDLEIRRIFDIKFKSTDFNYVVLNELNGFKTVYYLKNKKLQQIDLKTKKRQELDVLANQEIIYLGSNFNHDSLVCLSANGSIFSINYQTKKIFYYSNLDFNKFIIPNIITNKKRSRSFSIGKSNKKNILNDTLTLIYNIFVNNSSDKIVLNINKYILFWYQNNIHQKHINNNLNNNKIENLTGTIYSLFKDNEIEKCGVSFKSLITNRKKILCEGVCTIFGNNYFLGSFTRIFYVILIKDEENWGSGPEIEKNLNLYIIDYLFKFDYKDRFRCIADFPNNDFYFTDLFNGAENEDLIDIKYKISSTNIYFMKKIGNMKENNDYNKDKVNQMLIKSNIRGSILAIIINDENNFNNLFNENTSIIYFNTETYQFNQCKLLEIIGDKLINKINLNDMDWICNDMFLLILTSNAHFFLININFQLIFLTDISSSFIPFDLFYIPSYFEIYQKKNNAITKNNPVKLFLSKQREDLFLIYNKEYIICCQINYKKFEKKIISMDIPQENFNDLLFLLKYFQIYLPNSHLRYCQSNEELKVFVLDIFHKYIRGMYNKIKDVTKNVIQENEIIKSETGIKMIKTSNQNNVEETNQDDKSIIDSKNLGLKQLKSETNSNLLKNIIRYVQIFRGLNQVHEKNLNLISFLIGESNDFLIHLINHQEIFLAVFFMELCEKYLCSELLLYNINNNSNNNNYIKLKKNVSLSKIIFKSNNLNEVNSETFISCFFDTIQCYKKSVNNKGLYSRMRLLLIFFCLIEFRDDFALDEKIKYFTLAKFVVEKLRQKNMLDDLLDVTKILIKNYKYLKHENEKAGKDEYILSSISMNYRDKFLVDMKITKNERDDINFDFISEFYSTDDFSSFVEPSVNFCKNDDIYLLSDFNYLNNTGILQRWVIFLTNYLYFELFQDIKKYMDNHLRQTKDKTEENTSPEEKNLGRLIYFNIVFILQYIQIFLKKIILFLTQKEFNSTDKYTSSNFDENNSDNKNINNNTVNSKNNEEDELLYKDNYSQYSDKIQNNYNKILFKSISPIDIPFIIFSFYVYETNPNNNSKAYDINKDICKKINLNSRICLLTMDDMLEFIEFINLNGFSAMSNNIMISQIPPHERLQQSIFTSFIFYFFILHKLNLIYLLESELPLINSVLDALTINQRKQMYEIILVITNGILRYYLKKDFNKKISSVEGKYLEILLSFIKIIFYKMVREESCFVRKNISDFIRISPSIMSSYLLEGALYYEYKNCNKISKSIIDLNEILLNNIHMNKKKLFNDNKIKIPENISIFEILYGLSGSSSKEPGVENQSNNLNYGKDKKVYRQITMILFNQNKLICKQFLILLNNLTKLLQINSHPLNKNKDSDLLIFKFEEDSNYIKQLIQSKFSSNDNIETSDEERDISNSIISVIDLIIKGNFDNKTIFKFNNNDIKTKLIKNFKLIISKILHLLYEIQIKIQILIFEYKNTLSSKIKFLSLLSQGILCETNPKILYKIINDMLSFIKLLNIKQNSELTNNKILKEELCKVIKNIKICIIMNLDPNYEKNTLNDIINDLGYEMHSVINDNEVMNLIKIIIQITSKKLKNFLFYSGIGISYYLDNIKKIYNDLIKLTKNRPIEKLLVKARKQYIYLAESFYNIIGIPQNSFIELNINWQMIEIDILYKSIISDDLEDNSYSEGKSNIIMNKRQTTGKETPRKMRKFSITKKNEINIHRIEVKKEISDKMKNSRISSGEIIGYNKNLLKIKKNQDDEINYNDYYNEKLFNYFKNTVRKLIYNRFVYSIFSDSKDDNSNNNTINNNEKIFKLYSISPKKHIFGDNDEHKNVEVIILNPLFIV